MFGEIDSHVTTQSYNDGSYCFSLFKFFTVATTKQSYLKIVELNWLDTKYKIRGIYRIKNPNIYTHFLVHDYAMDGIQRPLKKATLDSTWDEHQLKIYIYIIM